MSKIKIFLPLSLAIACVTVSGVKSANAQMCDEMAPIGDPTACKASARFDVIVDPLNLDSPQNTTNSQSGPVDASVSASTGPFQNPKILSDVVVNFSGTGESSVMTGLPTGEVTEAPVEIRNSCQLDVNGTRGIILGFSPTLVACSGGFQEEVFAIDEMGMPLDLGTLRIVWAIEGVTLKTHTTGIPEIGMSADFSFVASDFSDPNPANLEEQVQSVKLFHSKDPLEETCTLIESNPANPFVNPRQTLLPVTMVTIGEETLPGCEYSLPPILVEIDVEPTEANGNRYLFGGATAGFAQNNFIFSDAYGNEFSARALVENENTVSFAGVFLDNSVITPESIGAILDFGSGITSPNFAENNREVRRLLRRRDWIKRLIGGLESRSTTRSGETANLKSDVMVSSQLSSQVVANSITVPEPRFNLAFIVISIFGITSAVQNNLNKK